MIKKDNMTKTEVKKYLYKRKPNAGLMYIRQGHAYYRSGFCTDEDNIETWVSTYFKIPVSDMGSTDFLPTMPAQTLNRWLYLPEN